MDLLVAQMTKMRQFHKTIFKIYTCQFIHKLTIQMEGLSIYNFKSYRKDNMFGFNPFINVIIGGNGQGKSNVFKALSFVLSDRLQINRTQFNNCLHRGVDVNNDRDIEVEVVMKQNDESSDLVKVAKIWKPNLTQECYVNAKLTNKKEFENFIDGLCLSYTNPYNIVQQGKINQVILMDEFQLYRLLEEITGMKKFNKRKEQAISLMNKVSIEKKQIIIILEELEEKLKSLEVRKEQFQFFSVEEKTKKFRTRKHLLQLLDGTRHNLQKIKNQYNEVSESLAKILHKKKTIQQNMEDANFSIKLQKQKLALIQKQQVGGGGTQIAETQELKELQKKQKQLHKELKEYAKQIKEKDKQVQNFKKGFSEIEQKYQNMKLNKEVNKPKESKEKVVVAYEADIKLEQNRLSQIQEQKKRTNQKIEQIQKWLKIKKNIEQEERYHKLQEQKEQLIKNRQESKKLNSQLAWQRNVASIQTESLKQIVHQAQIKLRKVLPTLDFGLLQHLRSSNVRGVYGYFIQFVKIDPSVNFAYQMAGINRLCSLIVQNEEACVAVIEANRKLKGRQINIIQLDYLRNRPTQSQPIPKSENAHKLSNSKWIKPNSLITQKYPEQLEKDIQKLIKNTFEKYALVKDYQTGLKVSKEYHLNCITGDREVVYAQGYHCKLGQENTYKENNLDLFTKFQEKKQNYIQKLREKQQLESRMVQNENQQINLINKENKIQGQLNKSAFSVNEVKTQRKMLESYQKNNQQLLRNQKDIQASLKRKKNALAVINSNNSKIKDQFKMTKAQCEKIQTEYSTKRKELNKMLTQIYGIEEIIQKLSSEKEELDNLVIKTKNSKAAGIQNVGVVGREIQSGLRQRQDEIREFEREIEQLNKIQKEIQGNKDHLEIKLITYRAEEEDIEKNIQEIGEIEENIEQLQQLSNSMSVSLLHGKRKNYHFSAKDKLLFTKFSNIFQSFNENKKTFKDLEEAQQKINKRIEQYQIENEAYMNDVAGKFEREFIQIFGFIVNQGHAEVRLKKISQKVRDVVKYKNCLTVMVSFSPAEEAMKKWNDFSGGEKTVIAISMILALQRCEPAPFYVLDQIDSALDSVYVRKIAQLLSRQSQKNKCQYFVSSFKEDMMIFPDQICNYYLVTCQNRQSSMQKIKQSNAIEALRTFTVKK